LTESLPNDREAYAAYWRRAREAILQLPPKPKRSPGDAAAVQAGLAAARASRSRFMRAYAGAIYGEITAGCSQFLRVDELCRRAAAAYPGLVPSDQELKPETGILQRDKDGLEFDQGIFLAQVLADPQAGMHLCHAMLLAHPETQARLAEYA
jgi:thioesterase DpgC